MTAKRRELGNLLPLRRALVEIEEWEAHDRERRGEDDQVVRALRKVRRRLEEALADAENPRPELSIDEYAELEGISLSGAYKRWQRGQIPGAKRIPGKGIVIPIDYMERAA